MNAKESIGQKPKIKHEYSVKQVNASIQLKVFLSSFYKFDGIEMREDYDSKENQNNQKNKIQKFY